jgi:hypothetical protein
MTEDSQGRMGRLDDEQEAAEPSSTTDGPAADGVDDPSQGSPGGLHPVGEDFPDEAVRYDEPGVRRRSEQAGSGEGTIGRGDPGDPAED